MSYTKQTWATGDTVTASKLNHMEDGIAGAGGFDAEILLSYDGDNYTGTIISGTYASLMTLIGNNTPPSILIRYWLDGAPMSGAICDYYFYGTPGDNNSFQINFHAEDDYYWVRWTSGDTLTCGILGL